MNALFTFYRAQFKISLEVQFQYRAAMVIWMIGLVLEPIIYLVVWTTVARSSGGSIGSYKTADFAAYYIVLMIVSHVILMWHMWEYEVYIREGILSGRLLRPLHPIHQDAAENIAYKVLMAAVLFPILILTIIFFQPALTPSFWEVVMFIPAAVLAGVLGFVIGWTVAMAAFWTTRTIAVGQTYFIAMFFFSGLPFAAMDRRFFRGRRWRAMRRRGSFLRPSWLGSRRRAPMRWRKAFWRHCGNRRSGRKPCTSARKRTAWHSNPWPRSWGSRSKSPRRQRWTKLEPVSNATCAASASGKLTAGPAIAVDARCRPANRTGTRKPARTLALGKHPCRSGFAAWLRVRHGRSATGDR